MANVFKLNNIIYRYNQNFCLFLPELTIASGKITTLLGNNGSGKSTLLNLLALLMFPDSGEIQFFGKPITQQHALQYRKRIGLLTQKPYMLRGTVLNNIALALKFHGVEKSRRQKRAMAMLERLDIAFCAEQEAKSLSGGELQKAALARILVLDPDVLLLDEPFSYLDQTSAHLLENFITSYVHETGKTLLFSTHNRLQGMALASNVISLANGKSVATPLINLFHGKIHSHRFDTGNISIALPDDIVDGNYISIDPGEIIISREPLTSSIRNHFTGRIISISEESGNIRVTINAGEKFHALITHQSLNELNLNLGDIAWIHFKSNCVSVF